jgi:hypothetical protein
MGTSRIRGQWPLAGTVALAAISAALLAGASALPAAAGEADALQITATPTPFEGLVIDDLSPGFLTFGPAKYWNESGAGYLGHSWWTHNNARQVENYGQWLLGISDPGEYELYIFLPQSHATTHQAHYSVHHALGSTEVTLDQGSKEGGWHLLGSFHFAGGAEEYVQLVDQTDEEDGQYEIAFDALGYRPASAPVSGPDLPELPPLPELESEFLDRLWQSFWPRIQPWVERQMDLLERRLDQWVERQKLRLLREIQQAINQWLENQCMSGTAALLLPLATLALWHRKRQR